MSEAAKVLYRLDIILPEEQAELAQAFLFQHIQYGWEEENLPENKLLIRVHCELKDVLDLAQKELSSFIPQAEFSSLSIENKDWTNDWKAYFTPVQAGRFLVLPAWEKEQKVPAESIPLYIDPKSAFGTGHHATTALCLHALSQVYDSKKFQGNESFLDLGCGTGILGIACHKLGFKGTCVDIDPVAISNTKENFIINNIYEGIDTAVGGVEAVQNTYHIVLANILAQPLVEMAPSLMKCVKKGGCLILSGILASQAEKVIHAYSNLGAPKVTEAKDVPHICPPTIASTEIQSSETWVVLVWDCV